MKLSLRKLTVANFRGVRAEMSLDFSATPPGLYFVRGVNRSAPRLGSNGAGKSTLFSEALIWVLTGVTSSTKRPGAEVENRAARGAKTRVIVEFELDGGAHAVERSRNPNGLMLDGKTVVQQEIYDLLPLTDAVLRKSLLIGQFGEMFLSLPPEAKSKIFTDTLELDRWIRAADTASSRGDSARRAVDNAVNKTDSCSRVLDEVYDRHDRALEAEKRFEAEVRDKLKAARAAVASAREAAQKARAVRDDARKSLDRISDEKADAQMKTVMKTSSRLQVTLREATLRSAKTAAELSTAKKALHAYHENAERCPECGQRIDRDHVKRRRAELVQQVETLEGLVTSYAGQVESCQVELEAAEQLVAELGKKLVGATEAKAVFDVAESKLVAADAVHRRTEETAAELKDRGNPYTQQCDELEVRIKELKAEMTEHKRAKVKAETELAIYEFWTRGFKEIRLQQIDSVLAELELAAARHAESLGLEGWGISFATDRETKRGGLSLGFNVQLFPPGSTESVSLTADCGGEVQRWQLAVSFGLAEVLLARAGISPDFEVLDEPTTHLSPEGIEDLLQCLSDRARELERRVFLIDHNSLERGAFDGVVLVAMDEKQGTCIEDAGGVLQVTTKHRERAVL